MGDPDWFLDLSVFLNTPNYFYVIIKEYAFSAQDHEQEDQDQDLQDLRLVHLVLGAKYSVS
jgi:hypothetical protein